MKQEEYLNNLGVIKERLDYYRSENRTLTEENRLLKQRLSDAGESMDRIKDASSLVESSYGEVVRAYEAELEKQQKINKQLHSQITGLSRALEEFQKTFVGKLFMYFFGRSHEKKA